MMSDRPTVLLVDGSVEDRALEHQFLMQTAAEAPFTVLMADSTAAGLVRCQQAAPRPDIIVLNSETAAQTAIGFLAALAELATPLPIPVLVVLSPEAEAIAPQLMQHGAQSYLIKGTVTPAYFRHIVQTTINQSRCQQQLRQHRYHHQLIDAIARRIQQSLDLPTLLTTTVNDLRAALAVDRVIVCQFAPDQSATIVAESVLPTWPICLNQQISAGSWADDYERYSQGVTQAIANVTTANLPERYRQLLRHWQIKAELVVPILVHPAATDSRSHPDAGLPRLWGLLCVHQCATPRLWQEAERQLLPPLANHIAIAMRQADLTQTQAALHTRLEQLRQTSEAKLQAVLQNAIAAFCSFRVYANEDWIYDYYSDGSCTIYGYTPQELTEDKHLWLSRVHPEDRENIILPLYEQIFNERTITYEYRFHHKDESWRWHLATLTARLDAAADCWVATIVAIDITARKQAEEALQNSQERYKSLAEALPMCLFRKDRHDRVTFANQAFLNLLGVSLADCLGKTTSELNPSDLAAKYQADDQRVLTKGEMVDVVEMVEIPTTGVRRYIHTMKTPIRDSNGNIVELQGIFWDVTEQRLAEKALQQAHQELAYLVANTPLATIKWDQEFRVQQWSQRAEAIFGWDAADVIGKGMHDWPFIFAADRSMSQTAAPMQGQPGVCYYRNYHKDGSVVDCEWYNSVLLDESGNPVAMLSLVQDVSDRKRAEAERHRAEMALRHSEARFRAIFEQAALGITQATLTGELVSVNQRFCDLLGYTEAELLQRRFQDITDPTDMAASMAVNHQIASGEDRSLSVEKRYLRKDGQPIWANLTVSLLQTEPEAPRYLIGIIEDISDRKAAELSLRHREARLQRLASNIAGMIYQYVIYADGSEAFMYVSPKCREIYELEPEALLQDFSLVWAMIHPDDIEQVRQANVISAQRLEPFDLEFRLVPRSGCLKWVRAVSQPEQQSNGDIIWDGLVLDITAHKTAQLEKIQLRERLQFLLATTPAVLFTCKADGDYSATFMSGNVELILGYEPRAFMEDPGFWVDHIHPDDAPSILTELGALFEQGYHTHEYRFRHKDGRYRWVQNGLRLVRNAQGAPIEIAGYLIDITDRKQVEANLRQSEAKHRALLSALPDLVMHIAHDGTYLDFFTTDTFNVLGDAAAIVGTTVADSLPPHLAQKRIDAISAALQTKTLQVYEQDIDVNGATQTEEVRIAVCGDDDVLVTVRDITERRRSENERRQAEAALRESEERFRQFADNVDAVFWIKESDTHKLIYVNRKYEELWGRPRQDLYSNTFNFMDGIHPDDRAAVAAAVTTQQYNEFDEEYRVVTPEGNICWVHDRAFPICNEMGQVYRIAGIAEDITTRKEAELALRESEERFRAVFEQAAVGIEYTDLDGRFLLVNQTLCNLLGYPSDELLTLRFQDVTYKADLTQNLSYFEQLLAGELSNYVLEKRFVHKDGTPIWVELTVSLIRTPSGEPKLTLAVVQDIRDRKQTAVALQQAKDAAIREANRSAEANRAKSIFLANMSHELRTPLNAILGFSQLLGFDPSLSPEHQEQINIINHSGEHLLGIINDILEMSKIEAGQITFNASEFNLCRLLDTIEEMFQLRAESKGLQLNCDRAFDLPSWIQTDENKLRQILINLLSNAVKFTSDGHVVLRVRLEPGVDSQTIAPRPLPYPATHTLICEVEDTGPGIDPNEQISLFEPFVQSKSGKMHVEGTGLGLAISRQFAHLLGGELTVSSQLGSGATFRLCLPINADVPVSVPARSDKRAVALAPGQPTYRILLVEDNWSNRQLMLSLLKPLGFEVRQAEHGQAAVALWEEWQPDLIWMDIRMPVMDGYVATQQIRAREANRQASPMPRPRTKIIALTAEAFEEDRASVLAAGCDDFVRKPLQERLILEKMVEHLGVQYIYTAVPTTNVSYSAQLSAASTRPSSIRLDEAALQVMPIEWITQLHHAAIQLNSRWLQTLIQQIPATHNALAQALQIKVNNFDFEHIMNLAQTVLDQVNQPGQAD